MRRERVKERNFRLGVMNGVFVNAGDAFLHAGLVLAPFLAVLGAPAVIIGLVPAIKVGGWYLPQLLVANRISHEPLKLRFYHITSTIRSTALLVMTAAVFFVGGDSPSLVILIVLVMLTINAIAGGVGGVPFADVTAKIVPHSRLGTFWAMRNAIGGLLGLGAGIVLRAILDSDMRFPHNFGLIFLLGSLLSAIAYASFSFVKEPPGVPGMKRPLVGMLREIPGMLRADVALRRFLRVRFLGLAMLLAEPFYAVYAIRGIGAPDGALGTYVMAATAAAVLGNLAFGVLSNRGRNVTVMQVGYALLMAAPICAMLIGDWRWYSVVFVLSAVGNAGVGIAASNLLYAIAPLGDRALYIGLSNTVLTIPSLAPVLAGALLTWLVMPTMFAAAAVLGAVTLAFSFRFGTLREADLRALGASRAQLASENESAASGDASPANAASQNVVTEVPEAD